MPEPSLVMVTWVHWATGSASLERMATALPGQKWMSAALRWPSSMRSW